MKILMVASFLPYPLYNGGNIRLYNLLKYLSRDHDITLICEKRKYQTEKDIEEVKKFCKKLITVDRKKQWTFKNIINSAFSLAPFLIVGHTNSDMKKKINKELVENNFDLIHVETFYVFQNLPKTEIPIVLAEHNIEYLVYKRYADHAVPYIKPFLNLDILKIKKNEEQAWAKATKLIVVSDKEKEIANKDASVISNGVDIDRFSMQDTKLKFEEKEKRILFIGDFSWIENIDSAKWILKKIWPKINLKFNIKLWIVGRKIPKSLRNLADKNVIFDENISNTSEAYKKSFILLSPIKVGGGTSFKILEAMASGVPVVTTTLGAEGIGGKNELIIADSTEDIINSLENLLLDKDLYEKITRNARKIVEEKFDWERIVKKLNSVYKEILND